MGRHKIFVIVLMAVFILSSCISAQQARDRRIARKPELFSYFPTDIQEKVHLGRIDLGFTQDMVRLAWGNADRIYSRTTEKGMATIWTYTRTRTLSQTDRMSIPVRLTDSNGKSYIQYRNVWINRDTEEEYAVARVEFTEGVVTAIEQLNQM